MDQSDQISRRDAVIGISFLGALMVALSATIVYRIVDDRPPKRPQYSAPIAAASREPDDEALAAPAIAASTLDDAVEMASHEAPGAAPSHEQSTAGIAPATPTFVAPSNR